MHNHTKIARRLALGASLAVIAASPTAALAASKPAMKHHHAMKHHVMKHHAMKHHAMKHS
jgi:hypothetical protein